MPQSAMSDPKLPETAIRAETKPERSVLEHLLHALNQPLTGLQCAMEVALAAPRTVEHYVRTLQDGIELTGRMRALVEAIREVMSGQEAAVRCNHQKDSPEPFALRPLVEDIIEELAPVAEAARVRMMHDFGPVAFLRVRTERATLAGALFRLLESAVSVAEPGSDVGVEICESAGIELRIHWTAAAPWGTFSRAELGVLVAQAALEQMGAQTELHGTANRQTVAIRLPGADKSIAASGTAAGHL